MKLPAIAIAVATFSLSHSAAFADQKPSDAEAAKMKEAAATWGCEGGEYEKESEASGVYEIDDATCKGGLQFDLKFDKDFKLIAITKD